MSLGRIEIMGGQQNANKVEARNKKPRLESDCLAKVFYSFRLFAFSELNNSNIVERDAFYWVFGESKSCSLLKNFKGIIFSVNIDQHFTERI